MEQISTLSRSSIPISTPVPIRKQSPSPETPITPGVRPPSSFPDVPLDISPSTKRVVSSVGGQGQGLELGLLVDGHVLSDENFVRRFTSSNLDPGLVSGSATRVEAVAEFDALKTSTANQGIQPQVSMLVDRDNVFSAPTNRVANEAKVEGGLHTLSNGVQQLVVDSEVQSVSTLFEEIFILNNDKQYQQTLSNQVPVQGVQEIVRQPRSSAVQGVSSMPELASGSITGQVQNSNGLQMSSKVRSNLANILQNLSNERKGPNVQSRPHSLPPQSRGFPPLAPASIHIPTTDNQTIVSPAHSTATAASHAHTRTGLVSYTSTPTTAVFSPNTADSPAFTHDSRLSHHSTPTVTNPPIVKYASSPANVYDPSRPNLGLPPTITPAVSTAHHQQSHQLPPMISPAIATTHHQQYQQLPPTISPAVAPSYNPSQPQQISPTHIPYVPSHVAAQQGNFVGEQPMLWSDGIVRKVQIYEKKSVQVVNDNVSQNQHYPDVSPYPNGQHGQPARERKGNSILIPSNSPTEQVHHHHQRQQPQNPPTIHTQYRHVQQQQSPYPSPTSAGSGSSRSIYRYPVMDQGYAAAEQYVARNVSGRESAPAAPIHSYTHPPVPPMTIDMQLYELQNHGKLQQRQGNSGTASGSSSIPVQHRQWQNPVQQQGQIAQNNGVEISYANQPQKFQIVSNSNGGRRISPQERSAPLKPTQTQTQGLVSDRRSSSSSFVPTTAQVPNTPMSSTSNAVPPTPIQVDIPTMAAPQASSMLSLAHIQRAVRAADLKRRQDKRQHESSQQSRSSIPGLEATVERVPLPEWNGMSHCQAFERASRVSTSLLAQFFPSTPAAPFGQQNQTLRPVEQHQRQPPSQACADVRVQPAQHVMQPRPAFRPPAAVPLTFS